MLFCTAVPVSERYRARHFLESISANVCHLVQDSFKVNTSTLNFKPSRVPNSHNKTVLLVDGSSESEAQLLV